MLQPLLQAIFRVLILGRHLKTVKKPYIVMVSHCGKIATAIQRRIGEANNVDVLSELGEDVEAHHRPDDSTVAHECAASPMQAAGYQYSETVIQTKSSQ